MLRDTITRLEPFRVQSSRNRTSPVAFRASDRRKVFDWHKVSPELFRRSVEWVIALHYWKRFKEFDLILR